MPREIGPLDVYKLLPMTNCKKCGEETCLAFAAKLADRKVDLELCTPLFEEDRYKKNLEELRELLRPAVKEVRIESEKRTVRIGGKAVMYRHELRYENPTAIAISVTDEMPEEEMLERVRFAKDFEYTYIGMKLKLDMIAIRCTSNDPSQFEKAVERVVEVTDMPLVLCSFDPEIMEHGLMAAKGGSPLIYAATEDNWRELRDLVLTYKCPLAVYAPANLNLLRSLANTLLSSGVENIVLDPGTFPDEGVRETLNNFTMLRRSSCETGDKTLGFPLIGAPITVWNEKNDPTVNKWKESYLASMLLLRYADLLILHSTDVWALLPLIILRTNIYTDPVKPVTVEPKLETFGKPTRSSPVMYTTNFALTYFTVREDLKDIDSYLLIIDTEGISVQSAVAGRKLTAEKIVDAINESGIEGKVDHKKLISPGLAARLKGETEDLTGWEVLVGPRDSSGIRKFLEDHWKIRSATDPDR